MSTMYYNSYCIKQSEIAYNLVVFKMDRLVVGK